MTLAAQNETPICGWTESLNTGGNAGHPENPCFDVNQAFNACTPVYVRINVHFFTNTSCDGPLQITNTSQNSAYQIAEDLINRGNNGLANNQIQWQSPGAAQVCQPIRYILSGVYTHCLNSAIGGYNTPNLHTTYGVNKNTEINVYIADFPPDASGDATGIAYQTYASIDWLDTGNFNHEIGHVFALLHSAFDDGCADTPPLVYSWDRNCDGDFDDSKEQGQQCWTIIESPTDANANGVDDCNEMSPCANSPCCTWAFVNNNVMAYGKFKTAYTECQVKKMLTDLAVNDCNYIAKIGTGCPPPSAFITQIPLDILNTKSCAECLVLEASFNDNSHVLKIQEVATGIWAYNSGWQNGPATNFCFGTDQSFVNYLKPNTQYRAYLNVKNACDEEAMTNYVFTTPDNKCKADPGDPISNEMRISPNPAITTVQIKFGGDTNERFTLLAANNMTGNNSILLQNYFAIDGENTIDVTVSSLLVGSYTFSLLGEHHLYQAHFAKF